jgi:indole-3-glycerol phosphate synthase
MRALSWKDQVAGRAACATERKPNRTIIRTGTEVQAFSHWAPPEGTLGRIVAEAADRVDALRARERELGRLAAACRVGPSLAAALRGGDVAVLAEVKRRSPSKGVVGGRVDAAAHARAYVEGGARGISVLTEPKHFGGSPEDLVAVRAAVPVPVLKKDFHVDVLQLLEARALGASAVLLIARALDPDALALLAREAGQLELEVLIEVRDEAELARALETDATLIGVNNRNLETLAIDPATSERLIPAIPAGRVAIAESGVSSRADVERAAAAGADAVLVGSSISAAGDPAAAVRALAGVARRAR